MGRDDGVECGGFEAEGGAEAGEAGVDGGE